MNSFFAAKRSGAAQKTKVDKEHVTQWVEKYRPKSMEEVVFQSEAVAVLKKVLEGGDLPNILFYGPPGTGKTSAATAFCRQMYRTHEIYKDRVLELNASDERGIQVVRTRVKEFAQRSVAPTSMGSVSAQLKIIILDEADAMTYAAQAAMRRTMERYSKNTRFFLICNYVSRIIDPLTSRCAKFRFKPLPVNLQVERLKFICKEENVNMQDESLEILVGLCQGDLRKSITYLQSLARSTSLVNGDFIRRMTGRVDDEKVTKFLTTLQSLDSDQLLSACDYMRQQGYGVRQLITQTYPLLLDDQDLNDYQKAVVFEKMAVVESCLLSGADESLQLMDFAFCVQGQYQTAMAMEP